MAPLLVPLFQVLPDVVDVAVELRSVTKDYHTAAGPFRALKEVDPAFKSLLVQSFDN